MSGYLSQRILEMYTKWQKNKQNIKYCRIMFPLLFSSNHSSTGTQVRDKIWPHHRTMDNKAYAHDKDFDKPWHSRCFHCATTDYYGPTLPLYERWSTNGLGKCSCQCNFVNLNTCHTVGCLSIRLKSLATTTNNLMPTISILPGLEGVFNFAIQATIHPLTNK